MSHFIPVILACSNLWHADLHCHSSWGIRSEAAVASSSSSSTFAVRRALVALCCSLLLSAHHIQLQLSIRTKFAFPLQSYFILLDCHLFPGAPLGARIGSLVATCCQSWCIQSVMDCWPLSFWILSLYGCHKVLRKLLILTWLLDSRFNLTEILRIFIFALVIFILFKWKKIQVTLFYILPSLRCRCFSATHVCSRCAASVVKIPTVPKCLPVMTWFC